MTVTDLHLNAWAHEQPREQRTDVWLTPKWLIDDLGPFDLDPCAADKPRPFDCAKENYIESMDGLSLSWKGFVFMNPPYERKVIGPWMERLEQHANGIALVFARTDTRWFHDYTKSASGFLFLSKRIQFLDSNGVQSKGGCGSPSVLIAYGDTGIKRIHKIKDKGRLMVNDSI